MRNILLVAALALLPAARPAEPLRKPASEKSDTKLLPLKGAARDNSCAAFGPGFVKLQGSDTCVRISGAVSVGAGVSSGR